MRNRVVSFHQTTWFVLSSSKFIDLQPSIIQTHNYRTMHSCLYCNMTPSSPLENALDPLLCYRVILQINTRVISNFLPLLAVTMQTEIRVVLGTSLHLILRWPNFSSNLVSQTRLPMMLAHSMLEVIPLTQIRNNIQTLLYRSHSSMGSRSSFCNIWKHSEMKGET